MKRIRLANGLLALSLWHANLAYGGNNVIISFPPIRYVEPRDIATVWTPIASADHTDVDICNPNDAVNTFDNVIMDDLTYTSIGTISFEGVDHSIYPSNVSGIGWIFSARVTSFTDENNVPGSGGPLIPLLDGTVGGIYPFPGAGAPLQTFAAQGRMTFVKTQAHIPPGSYSVIPSGGVFVARFRCQRANSVDVDQGFAMQAAAASINIAAASCNLESPGEVALPFGNLNATQFPTVGSTSATQTVTVRLQCESNVNLAFTITDQSNPANRSENITLTPDSTAKGLEVQALNMRSGAGVYRLGPDSSVAGVENQYPIVNTAAGGGVDFPIGFQYIRTGTLTGGSANARVTLTFSYQ